MCLFSVLLTILPNQPQMRVLFHSKYLYSLQSCFIRLSPDQAEQIAISFISRSKAVSVIFVHLENEFFVSQSCILNICMLCTLAVHLEQQYALYDSHTS